MGFVRAVVEQDLQPGQRLALQLRAWNVLLIRQEDAVYAVRNQCTHQSSSLTEGRIRRGNLVCPLHGACFSLKTGKCAGGTYPDLRTFDTDIVDGWINVDIPEEAPAPGLTAMG